MNKTKIKIWIEKQLTNMNKIWSKCEQNLILANCKSNLRNALLSKICQKLQKFMKFCSNMKQHFHPSYDKYHSNRAWSNSFKSWIPVWNALFDVQISHLISGDSSCTGLRWPYFSLILFQATTVLLWESFGELIWFYLVRPLHIKGKTLNLPNCESFKGHCT